MRLRTPIPPVHADKWLNGGPDQIQGGAPLLVHFFAIGCEACKEQMPTLKRWTDEYGKRGLQFVGIHTPVVSTPEDVDEEWVEREVKAYGLTHPIAIDHDGHSAANFQLGATPGYFLFDQNGLLRHFHSGFRAIEPTEQAIQRVLNEWEAEKREQAQHAPA